MEDVATKPPGGSLFFGVKQILHGITWRMLESAMDSLLELYIQPYLEFLFQIINANLRA
jgi:hypothetical protein